MTARTLFALLAAAALAAPARAADATLDGLRLGKPIIGTAPETSALKGKVVMVEFWGINCGPCLASLPHVVRWNEELADFGLVVVGAHVQKGTPAEVKAKAEALGVRFPVTDGGSVRGTDFEGIPFCVVFDHTGKAVHTGHPMKAEETLRAAVGKGLVAAAGVSDPAKPVAMIVTALEKGGPPLDALKKLNGLTSNSDKKVAGQAKALAATILDGGQKRLDDAKANAKADPVTSYETAARLVANWKGTPVGVKAGELASKLKTDKAVVAETKVRPHLDTVKKLDAALTDAVGEDADLKSADFKKKFAPQLKQMTTAMAQMRKAGPDTRATKEAEEIAGKYDLSGK